MSIKSDRWIKEQCIHPTRRMKFAQDRDYGTTDENEIGKPYEPFVQHSQHREWEPMIVPFAHEQVREDANWNRLISYGTTSLVVGSASGIHAWHNDYYIRRIRVGKNEAIYRYLAEHHPELVADEHFNPAEQAVIEVPQRAPAGSILRHEDVHDLLERVKRFNIEWVRAGHRNGDNTHNVSCTISVKDNEWEGVGRWMWDNRESFNGISVLPYDGGTYIQAPFEDIDEATFLERSKNLHQIDLTNVVEREDATNLAGEVACGAGGCEVTMA